MRLIGTLEGRQRTEVFVAYLYSQKMRTVVEPQQGATDVWEVWVCDEDSVPAAKSEYDQFRVATDLTKYEESRRKAEAALKEEQQRKIAAAKNLHKLPRSGVASSGFWPPPITLTLIILAALVSLLTNFGHPENNNRLGNMIMDEMLFFAPSYVNTEAAQESSTIDPAYYLKKGDIWRVFTPIFIHLNELHLLFNLLTVIPLGRMVEKMEKGWRYGIFILLAAALPNLLQGLTPREYFGSLQFGGLSGIAFALFGFVWVKTTLQPSIGVYFPTSTVAIMLIWLVLGFTGQVGNIANLVHLGGLIVGLVSGWVSCQLHAK